MRTHTLLLTLLLTSLGSTASARPTLPPADQSKLEKGQALSYSMKVPGSKVMSGKSIQLIPDTPEAVAHVLCDVEKYKNYMPRVKESRVYKRQGAHIYAVVETDLPWPVKDCWISVKYTRVDKPGHVIEARWWMLNGTMKTYTGSALIEPWDKDGKKSVITYQLQADLKTSAPDSMISDGVKEIASTVVQTIKLRLAALRKYNKLPKGI
jgi:ribosome-associated toxin RatA of RatAB toxin-antitoxin module